MKKAYRPRSLEEVSSLKEDRLYGLINVRVFGKIRDRNLVREVLTLSSLGEETHSEIYVDFKLILKEKVAQDLKVGSIVQILGEVNFLHSGVVIVAHLVRDFSDVRPTLYQKYVSHFPLEKPNHLAKEKKPLEQFSQDLIDDLETQFLKYHSKTEEDLEV